MPSVRSANTDLPACLANSSPMMNVGLFIAYKKAAIALLCTL
jgi:hypothetical protein